MASTAEPGTARLAAHAIAPVMLAVFAFLGFAPQVGAQVATIDVGIYDDAGILVDSDHELLRSETAQLDLPPEVNRVEYLAFEENDDNFNDTVFEYAAENRPDMLDNPANPEDADRWASGLLVLAVGLDPQQAGVYCGDDVCAALELGDDARIDGVVDAMGDSFRADRFGPGLLEGARAAADPTVRDEMTATDWGIIGGVIALVGGITGGSFLVAHLRNRKKRAAEARTQYAYIGKAYGSVATNLELIDVRANSLTSPLADDRLRRDWEDVRSRFLEVDSILKGIPDLEEKTSDKVYNSHSEEIERAHRAVIEMEVAEANIDELYKMEHGDATVRRRQLTELHEDVLEARLGTERRDLLAELSRVGDRIERLRADLEAPDFMDRYTGLIGDYQVVVDALAKREMSDVEQHVDRTPPRIYDSSWRAGYGYNSFVPYVLVSSWHSADVQHQQATSDAGVNTSYSSGFTGGGGSGGW